MGRGFAYSFRNQTIVAEIAEVEVNRETGRMIAASVWDSAEARAASESAVRSERNEVAQLAGASSARSRPAAVVHPLPCGSRTRAGGCSAERTWKRTRRSAGMPAGSRAGARVRGRRGLGGATSFAVSDGATDIDEGRFREVEPAWRVAGSGLTVLEQLLADERRRRFVLVHGVAAGRSDEPVGRRMKLSDVHPGDVLTYWHDNGIDGQLCYARVVRVNRVTVAVETEHHGIRRKEIGFFSSRIGAGICGQVAEGHPFATCPVHGPHAYSDSFGAPRYAGGYHPHAGNDIFAPRDTPIVAPFDGYAYSDPNGLGGNAVIVRGSQGYVYNAHLDHYGTLGNVSAGTVIGYVGTSGNAPPHTPHLHFAIVKLTDEKRWWQGRPSTASQS